MEESEPQPNPLAAAFPTPPPFWQHFTEVNLERTSKLRVAQAAEASKHPNPATSSPVRLLDLPPELRFLQPPEPPADGVYRCFGDVYNLSEPLPTLEEQGIQHLYTPPITPTGDGKHSDRAFILKRLAKSLLLNFLELVGIMSVNPAQYVEKIQDLRTLFINFHHLLNEYRPHQARESLILTMHDQLERSRAETQGIMKMKEKVEAVLEGLGQAGLTEMETAGQRVVKESNMDEGNDIWDELDKEFG
ncbi:Uncharacterized protein BP5553_04388 [Venustampulla echinocandica]|uniref:Mediator of RNA polymerase II transcription subunit 7 n=1 Tax=Venustampulla echinocandica TaxID=2656787 RepID=A0A370TN58_9HELO|nr:Uncharacterized protein BP5553_04388 [Venustampulla echinocandica]RDL36955.1 Uncharacterized protein BP5553_04388 [Venustampulla echinocandica]